MQLVKPTIEIVDPTPYTRVLRNLERYGRVCYQSEPLGKPEVFLKRIIDKKHESVLEHEKVTVIFNTDRGITHELVRHRIASFSQESTRYCDYRGQVQFVLPHWVNKLKPQEITILNVAAFVDEFLDKLPEAEYQWLSTMFMLERRYQKLVTNGLPPQDARGVLPNALKTQIVVTANMREWRHIFKLRTAYGAHPDMISLMNKTLIRFQGLYPVLFDDIQVSMPTCP